MADLVLSIVNNARNRVGLTDMTASDFDTGIQREHLQLRSEFRNIYNYLARLGGEEFRKTFSLTTADGTNGYALGFDPTNLSSIQLYVQATPNNTQPYQLRYISEDQARDIYPNLTDIPEGIPYEWFIATTTTANTKLVYFINKPDGIYTILGYQQESPTTLNAASTTACDSFGDDFLEAKLSAFLRYSQGIDDAPLFEKEAEEALGQYICREYHVEQNVIFPCPRQRLN